MTVDSLAAPAGVEEKRADERRTVVPPRDGRPGYVRVERSFTADEREAYRAAVAEEEAARAENVHLAKAVRRVRARGQGVPVRGAMSLMRSLREEAGVSLTDLAAKAGMQKSSLSRLENEDRNPTVRTLERIAAALGKRLVVRLEDLPEPADAAAGEPAAD